MTPMVAILADHPSEIGYVQLNYVELVSYAFVPAVYVLESRLRSSALGPSSVNSRHHDYPCRKK